MKSDTSSYCNIRLIEPAELPSARLTCLQTDREDLAKPPAAMRLAQPPKREVKLAAAYPWLLVAYVGSGPFTNVWDVHHEVWCILCLGLVKWSRVFKRLHNGCRCAIRWRLPFICSSLASYRQRRQRLTTAVEALHQHLCRVADRRLR